MKKIIALILCLFTVFTMSALCACNMDANGNTSSDVSTEVSVSDSADMFTEADKEPSYDQTTATAITLSGTTATASSSSVSVSEGLVTIKSAGAYVVEGNATDQTIVIDADNAKVRLVLSDVSIINGSFAPLYIKNADKVFIILEGSNTLSVTGDFVAIDENTVDGTIFAKDDFTIQGDGSLMVASSNHGIVGKDDVKITGGNITVTATSHGIQANDSVRIADATLNITAGKDVIQVENTDDATKGYVYFESGYAKIVAGYDGISASSTIQITGGELDITAGGGSNKTVSEAISTKGVKAKNDILITDGTVTVNSSDDSVHSNDCIEISGGTLNLSSGDDGVHADSSLKISGGTVTVLKSYEGLEAQNVNISGGKITVTASDDGINAAGGNDSSSIGGRPGQNSFNTNLNSFITISGGEMHINANGDGIDSNGNLTVSGGTTIVEGPTDNGNGNLDYDGTATVTGGTFVAIGSSGMAKNFSSATQGCILMNVGSQRAGTTITLIGSDGNEVFSMSATKAYASVLITLPSLVKGGSYTLTAGSAKKTVTLSSLIYGGSSSMGGGQPGGVPGGMPGGMGRP